jgi:hypothetical protein
LLFAVLAQPALAWLAEADDGSAHERAVPSERLAGEVAGGERGEGLDGEGRDDPSFAPSPGRIAVELRARPERTSIVVRRRAILSSRSWETFAARAPPSAS